MFFKANLKIFIFLIVSTFLAVFLHRFGYLDTSLSVPYDNNSPVSSVVAGDVSGSLTRDGSQIAMRCHLDIVKTFNLCGVAIELGNGSLYSGINIGEYDRVKLELAYRTPMDSSKIKVSFRNFDSKYSSFNDLTSLKFNTIILNSSKETEVITVPLGVFKVENWWLEQYDIDFEDAYVDFSNVSRIEFLSHGMPLLGEYEILIKEVVLKGELITESNLFKVILLVWLFVGAIFLFKQHSKLNDMSKKDMLTGLYNRRGIQEKLSDVPSSHKAYMFYININEFKKINDTYGHDVGDCLLIRLSHFIEDKTKEFKNNIFISRFSGDEFVIILDNITHVEAKSLAYSIVLDLKEPLAVDAYNISISISLGIAKTQDEKKSFDILLAHSGAAMYHVKNNKSLPFQEFDDAFSNSIYFKKRVSEYLKEAILKNDFYLDYMPIYEAKSLEIVAFEILLRTKSNDMKGIEPSVFIHIAEEYNLIRAVDLWVIENTFKNIRENYDFLNNNPITFCINMSAEELRNPLFTNDLSDLLDKYNIPPKWIELELTETKFVEIDQTGIEILNSIRALGVKLSLDDFGTGYISFNQLVNYPVNSLKIDKSFIDLLEVEGKSPKMIIRAILSMADSYKLDTVAEGVETSAQYHYLLGLNCGFVQGFLFSKPVPWSVAKVLLAEQDTEKLKKIVMIS